jgi:hypothetical protein
MLQAQRYRGRLPKVTAVWPCRVAVTDPGSPGDAAQAASAASIKAAATLLMTA